MITGRTALYGVMGHPVSHSRSPEMQNAAFSEAKIDAVYVPLAVAPGALGEAIAGARALGFQGLNVTIPHKETAAAFCDELDSTAAEVGAVNTLRRIAQGWEGFNTDAPACLSLLEAAGVGKGSRALLLGAGGAARAAAWALVRLGCSLRIAARREDAAVALAAHFAPTAGDVDVPLSVPWEDLLEASGAADVIVNGTPAGLPGHPAALPELSIRSAQVVMDFVYGDTQLGRYAEAAGARLIEGEQLLVRQGALAFTLWTGRPAPEAVMAAAIAHPGAQR